MSAGVKAGVLLGARNEVHLPPGPLKASQSSLHSSTRQTPREVSRGGSGYPGGLGPLCPHRQTISPQLPPRAQPWGGGKLTLPRPHRLLYSSRPGRQFSIFAKKKMVFNYFLIKVRFTYNGIHFRCFVNLMCPGESASLPRPTTQTQLCALFPGAQRLPKDPRVKAIVHPQETGREAGRFVLAI